MKPYRCEDCGRFCKRLHPVYDMFALRGIDREICDTCWIKLGRKLNPQQPTVHHNTPPHTTGTP